MSRYLKALLIAALLVLPAWMPRGGGVTFVAPSAPFTLVSHTSFAVAPTLAGSVTSPSMDTSSANLAIVHTTCNGETQHSVYPIDSKGNFYWIAQDTFAADGGNDDALFYSNLASVGSGTTITLQQDANATGTVSCVAHVALFHNNVSATAMPVPSDVTKQSNVTVVGLNSRSWASPGALFVTGVTALNTSVLPTINAGLAVTDANIAIGGAPAGGLAYLIGTGAGSVNATWSNLTSGTYAGATVSTFVPYTAVAAGAGNICDQFTSGCSECYDLDEACNTSYSGPLFQLYNGTTTLDIGQTGSHTVDLSTWSAFCGGVAANCKYSKYYAQHNSANNLVPADIGPLGCSSGATFACATPFVLDSLTGKPIMTVVSNQEYIISGDANSTGINNNGAAVSEFLIGRQISAVTVPSYCCGSSQISHAYNEPDNDGTDFGIGPGLVGQRGGASQTLFTRSSGIDEESSHDIQDVGAIASLPDPYAILITTDTSFNVQHYYNNRLLFSRRAATAAFVEGAHLRLGGGGDMTQCGCGTFSAFGFVNAVVSQNDWYKALSHIYATHAAWTFPQ